MLNYHELESDYKSNQTSAKDDKKPQLVYVSAVILVFLIAGSISFGVKAYMSSQKQVAAETDSARSRVGNNDETALSALTQSDDAGTPYQAGVAGVSTTGDKNGASSFGLVETAQVDAGAPSLGTTGTCQVGTLFSIGEKENTPQDNPVDELSWVDALDVMPDYTNPFVVGVNSQKDFPWRTSQDNPDSTETDVLFNYAGNSAQAQVVLSWSPGKQGSKQKSVQLDGLTVGRTPMRSGEFSGAYWQNMPFFMDAFPISLETGEHTISLGHLNDGAGEAVWDYVSVEITDCN